MKMLRWMIVFLSTTAFAQQTNLLGSMVNGIFVPWTSSLMSGQVPTPPSIIAKCKNGNLTVDCEQSSGGGITDVTGTNPVVVNTSGTTRVVTCPTCSIGGGSESTSYPQLTSFGDSNTTPAVVAQANVYVNLLSTAQGIPLNNFAVSGDMACDAAARGLYTQAPPIVFSPLDIYMLGTNDANSKGVGSYEAIYNLCLKGGAAWLGSPAAQRYTGSSFGSLPTNWTADTTYATTGLKSTTNGACAVWPVTVPSSGTIAIWYRIIDGNGGAFTYQVDSGSTVSVNNFTSPAIATINGATQSIGAAFITSVAPGAHNVNTCVASATGAGNIVGILAVGTTTITPQFTSPTVFVAGVLYQENDANSAATAAYNADVIADVASLSTMGFGANFVDVRSRIKGTPAEMFNTLHLNNFGQAELEQLYVQAAQPIGSFDQTYKSTAFNSIVVGGSYTALVTDSVIFTNGANVSAPSGDLPGKTYFIYNFNSGATAVVFGTNLAPDTGTTVASSGGGNWFHVDPSSTEVAQFGYGQCNSGSINASLAEGAILVSGCTVNLPTTNVAGKTYFIANFNSGTFATLANASGGNANGYQIPPDTGVTVISSGPGVWWLTSGQGFTGFAVTATPGTNVTSAGCASGASCTSNRGTITIVGGTATTGTIASLAWSAPTPTAYGCTVTQNGGAVNYGVGNSVATTSGLNITADVSVIGATLNVNYSCQK